MHKIWNCMSCYKCKYWNGIEKKYLDLLNECCNERYRLNMLSQSHLSLVKFFLIFTLLSDENVHFYENKL